MLCNLYASMACTCASVKRTFVAVLRPDGRCVAWHAKPVWLLVILQAKQTSFSSAGLDRTVAKVQREATRNWHVEFFIAGRLQSCRLLVDAALLSLGLSQSDYSSVWRRCLQQPCAVVALASTQTPLLRLVMNLSDNKSYNKSTRNL